MQIIIEMPDNRYKDILRIASVQLDKRTQTVEQIIANGTPLSDIVEDIRRLDRSMECVLESDHRSFTNRETENGWIFDHIIAWRKMIQPYIKENENESND